MVLGALHPGLLTDGGCWLGTALAVTVCCRTAALVTNALVAQRAGDGSNAAVLLTKALKTAHSHLGNTQMVAQASPGARQLYGGMWAQPDKVALMHLGCGGKPGGRPCCAGSAADLAGFISFCLLRVNCLWLAAGAQRAGPHPGSQG
jgi:hypothetical protein